MQCLGAPALCLHVRQGCGEKNRRIWPFIAKAPFYFVENAGSNSTFGYSLPYNAPTAFTQ
jgi:hypothetical protein